MGLYDTVERNFFNSLTRKIVGNVIFLLLPSILFMGFNWYGFETLSATVAQTSNNPEVIATLSQLQMFNWLFFAVAIAASLLLCRSLECLGTYA